MFRNSKHQNDQIACGEMYRLSNICDDTKLYLDQNYTLYYFTSSNSSKSPPHAKIQHFLATAACRYKNTARRIHKNTPFQLKKKHFSGEGSGPSEISLNAEGYHALAPHPSPQLSFLDPPMPPRVLARSTPLVSDRGMRASHDFLQIVKTSQWDFRLGFSLTQHAVGG